jgi:hypothetical protein
LYCSPSCAMLFDFPYCCGVRLISNCKINFSQLQIQSIISTLTLQIRKHGYSGDFSFMILFIVDIVLLYAINLDTVSLFSDSSFTLLVKLNMWLYLMYYFNLNEWISFYFCQKKIKYSPLTCVFRLHINISLNFTGAWTNS